MGGRTLRLDTAHPDTPDVAPATPDLAAVEPLVTGLALPFVTVDLILRADGRWRVVELGDGQVSDRPTTTPAVDLIEALGTPSRPSATRSTEQPPHLAQR